MEKRGIKITKPKTNYLIDIGLIISFVLCFITGIIKWPKLNQFLNFSYSQLPMKLISRIHDFSGLIMGLLVLVHIILHWRWIVCMTKKYFKRNKNEGC